MSNGCELCKASFNISPMLVGKQKLCDKCFSRLWNAVTVDIGGDDEIS